MQDLFSNYGNSNKYATMFRILLKPIEKNSESYQKSMRIRTNIEHIEHIEKEQRNNASWKNIETEHSNQ